MRPSKTPVRPETRAVSTVFAGGLIGSAVREAITGLASACGQGRHVAVLVANLSGSFLLGWLISRLESKGRGAIRFWAIGVLGSFTTFSAFSVDTLLLLQHASVSAAAWYVTVSILGGLTLARIGTRIGTRR